MELSRSEQKRRIKDVERLVGELITLPGSLLESLSCPAEFRQMLKEADRLKGGARQRQIRYLTKLAKTLPQEELYRVVSDHRGAGLTEAKQLHELEYARDTLINEALAVRGRSRETGEEWGENWRSQTLPELAERFPNLDVSLLLRLSYLFAQSRNPRYSREIFRYLRAVQEQQARNVRRGG